MKRAALLLICLAFIGLSRATAQTGLNVTGADLITEIVPQQSAAPDIAPYLRIDYAYTVRHFDLTTPPDALRRAALDVPHYPIFVPVIAR
jgi:hypothetical protein